MFTLNYLGSVIKIEPKSEILVTDKGVFINPIASFKRDPSLEAAAEKADQILPDMAPKRSGKQKDPNSLHGRIVAFVEGRKAEGVSRRDIKAEVGFAFHDKPPSTVATYLSEALRGYHPDH
jgi:hypothetical protein